MNLFGRLFRRGAAAQAEWQAVVIERPWESSQGELSNGLLYQVKVNQLQPGFIRLFGGIEDVGTMVQYVIAPFDVKEGKAPPHQLSGQVLLLPLMTPEGANSYGSQQIPRHPTFYEGAILLCLRCNGVVRW